MAYIMDERTPTLFVANIVNATADNVNGTKLSEVYIFLWNKKDFVFFVWRDYVGVNARAFNRW